jgi:hypothetical protein
MSLLMDEGARSIGVFYDIFCHWSKNFWARSNRVFLPGGPPSKPDHFYGGIPKYHLAGHTDGCYAQYSLNNMPGVGRLDAEGCERAWADLNQASVSTSEKGPGFRIDSVNHSQHDWNWKKITGMGMFSACSVTYLTASNQRCRCHQAHKSSGNGRMHSTWQQSRSKCGKRLTHRLTPHSLSLGRRCRHRRLKKATHGRAFSS